MQLGGPSTAYGHVLNTRAIEGHAPEGRITVTWQQREGRHADGHRWTLQEPRYGVVDSPYGTLPPDTVLKPRIGPQVFGVGLLDAVPASALEAIRIAQAPGLRGDIAGRFGWQGDAASLVDHRHIVKFDRHPQFTFKVIDMPRVVVSNEIGDRNACIRPFGEKALQTREDFRDHVSVLDKFFEYVAEKVQVIQPFTHGLQ